jgi:uncharacterized protein (TIGR02246 family)
VNDGDLLALVREVETAWNEHDMTRFAACFAVDADFVNVGGMWWKGRPEIEQRHTVVHAGPFRESVLTQELAAFREVSPGVGVAHVTWQLEGHAPSGPRQTTDTRRGIQTWIVVERDGLPEIAAAQNTDAIA